jgi:hypothetical protein
MTVFGLWHGGIGYSHSEIETDLERFGSIAEAEEAMRDRETNNSGAYTKDFKYVYRAPESVLLPAVEGSSMDLFVGGEWGDPIPEGGAYPDYRLTIGPRGGIVRESY